MQVKLGDNMMGCRKCEYAKCEICVGKGLFSDMNSDARTLQNNIDIAEQVNALYQQQRLYSAKRVKQCEAKVKQIHSEIEINLKLQYDIKNPKIPEAAERNLRPTMVATPTPVVRSNKVHPEFQSGQTVANDAKCCVIL